MATTEIPITCPNCGAGMSSPVCFGCGWDAAKAIGAAEGPTNRYDDIPVGPNAPAPMAAPPPRRTSGPSVPQAGPRRMSGPAAVPAQKPTGSYLWLVLVALVEWALGAVALIGGLKGPAFFSATLGPAAGAALEPLVTKLISFAGAMPVAGAGAASVLLGLLVLTRMRWAWAFSFFVCVGSAAIGFLVMRQTALPEQLTVMAPGGAGFLLLLLGSRSPR